MQWINWHTKENAGRELYDEQADPQENVYVAQSPDNKEVVRELSQRLRGRFIRSEGKR